MDTILNKILERKRRRVADLKSGVDLAELESTARRVRQHRTPARLFTALAEESQTNIIAEFKRASPSKGTINEALEPRDAAAAYEAGGAAAISVLTEEDFFRGSLDDLRSVRAATDLPVLRKDFFIDAAQVFESAAAGADAILLIAAVLTIDELRSLQSTADSLGLDTLIEIHDLEELEIAIEIGATLIGVNNRNLKTFEVSLDVSRELIPRRPRDTVMITESGIASSTEIQELRSLGFDGFLIGETLMRSGNPAATLRELIKPFSGEAGRV